MEMEIRIEAIKLARSDENPAIRAYIDVVIGDLVAIRGLRVVKGADGRYFLVFPSKPHSVRCPQADCRRYGPAEGRFCPHCGAPAGPRRADTPRNHEVVAPVDAAARSTFERLVFAAFLSLAGHDKRVAQPEGVPKGVSMR